MHSDNRTQLIQTAVEQSALPLVVTSAQLDPPGPEVLYVNDAYIKLTGYSRDELIGATPRINQGPATDRAVLERLKTNLRAGIMFEGAIWNYRKDGTPYLVEWTVMPLRLAGGATDYFFAVQRDITDGLPDHADSIGLIETSLHALHNRSDTITGAQNRDSMLRYLQQAIDNSVESNSTTGLIKLRLRRMDRINRVFDALTVNRLLRDIAQRLASVCKHDESIARPREDTFAITVPGIQGSEKDVKTYLDTRARALHSAMTAVDFGIGDDTVQIEAVVGIGQAPTDAQDADKLALLVDDAAQCVNLPNEDFVFWASYGGIEQDSRQLALERDLRKAVNESQLVVYYQPICELARGQLAGAEALVRWPHTGDRPPIGPDEFIPLAESLGLINRLGLHVFGQACHQLHDWQAYLHDQSFWISVNVAPRQLMDRHLVDRLLALTRAAGVYPNAIKLEITESALEQDFDTVKGVVDDLVAAGFPLALDDFGKGHSSLERVIGLPFSVIKVDRSFVWQTPNGPGAAIITGVSAISRQLQMSALGEGVETLKQGAFLRNAGFRYAQGYLYGKPVAAEDFPFTLGA